MAEAVDESFRLLAEVAQGEATKWSIVYDLSAGVVHFRTLSAPSRRYVTLDDLDFACSSPVRYVDLGRNVAGDLAGQLSEYRRSVNRRLIASAYRQTSFLKDTPEESIDEAAAYPESMTCDETP